MADRRAGRDAQAAAPARRQRALRQAAAAAAVAAAQQRHSSGITAWRFSAASRAAQCPTRWSGSMPLTSPGGLLIAPHVSSVSMPSSASSSCHPQGGAAAI